MAEQQQPPVMVMQAEQKSSKGKSIVSIVLIIVLVTLGFYGFSWASSDIGRQRLSDFFYTVKTSYNPFSWYGEQLKGAQEIGRIWETKPAEEAEKVGIDFQAFESVGSKIVPSGTPLAFRYKLDVGEGVQGIKPKLDCVIKDQSSTYISEEELIESKTFRPDKIELFTDNPLSYANILCQVTTKKKSEDRMLTAEGKLSFPFQQRGSLTVYLTKDATKVGKTFFQEEGIEEKLPIMATYNNEPVELGIGVSDENIQPVVIGENQFPAVGISLKNRWNGKVIKVISMSLVLPKGAKIDKKNSPPSLLCPFGESASLSDKYIRYEAEEDYLKQIPEFGKGIGDTFQTSQRFFCWLDIEESVLEEKPHVKKEYSADVSYEYEFLPKTVTVTLKGVEGVEEEEKEEEELKYYICQEGEKYSCVTECKEESIILIYDDKDSCEIDLVLYK